MKMKKIYIYIVKCLEGNLKGLCIAIQYNTYLTLSWALLCRFVQCVLILKSIYIEFHKHIIDFSL